MCVCILIDLVLFKDERNIWTTSICGVHLILSLKLSFVLVCTASLSGCNYSFSKVLQRQKKRTSLVLLG